MLPSNLLAANPAPLTTALPTGPITTLAPWHSAFGCSWDNITRWAPQLEAASRRFPRATVPLLGSVMVIESCGNHYDAQGRVIKARPDGYGGGRATGLMQIKDGLWANAVPGADINDPGGNILIGAKLLHDWIGELGSWERAIAEQYHPGTDPHSGANPQTYVRAVRSLLREWPTQDDPEPQPEPEPEPGPITFGRVPHPPFEDRIVTNSRAWDDLGPRQIVGVCVHSMVGTLNGTDSYFRGAAAGSALTDYGVGGSTDGALDGVIYRWNDPRGRRSPWANGPTNDLEGDGPAFVRAYGVTGVGRDLVSIERSDGGNTETPSSPKQFESIAAIIAFWMDQAQVPWSSYPINPAKGVVTHLEHWEFGPKQCPFTPMRARTTELQARVRAILKLHQLGIVPSVPEPEIPSPDPIDPADGYPVGMDAELAARMFGRLTRISTGQTYPFDPSDKGIVSMAWLARGDAEDAFPAADEWIDYPDGRRVFTFANGWSLLNDPSNEKRDWLWIGDEGGA